ncbi:MAG: methionine synthase, partial [Euryarchaeota archaeon]|nr:methionine synthase [Euryarchaeota archaeon]
HYDTKDELIMAIAKAENQELKELVKAGATFIQIDEPAMSTHTEDLEIFEEAIAATVRGVKAHTAIHSCYGDFSTMYPDLLGFKVDQFALEFANNDFRTLDLFKEHEYTKELGLGVNDVHIRRVESVEEQMKNIERAIEVVPPEKIYVNPDCGLKLLPRQVAYEKMVNMVKAARMMREKLG